MTPEMWGIFLQIVILLAFGYFFTKKKILTSDIKNGLSTLLLKLVLPISILGSSQIAYDASTLSGFGITLVISFVFYFVFLFILRMVAKRLPLKDNADRVFPLLCVFGNVGFIEIPLSTQFFGPTGLMYAFSLNVAFNIALFSYGLMILSGESKVSVKSVLTDPCLICTVVMLALYVAPFRFPSFVGTAFTMTGNMMTPLAMLIIGHEIANMKVLDLIKDGWAYVVSLLRLLVIPTIVCVIFMFLPVDHEVLKVLVFLLAMPCGTLNVILSQQYGTNPQFASRATTQTMILFLITVPIMLVIINTLL